MTKCLSNQSFDIALGCEIVFLNILVHVEDTASAFFGPVWMKH